jgi:hypothetical protein
MSQRAGLLVRGWPAGGLACSCVAGLLAAGLLAAGLLAC